ncbi:MAG TPA: alkaline phosphatase family protein, partial [Candidatus Cybelea sp.]|nr:alkaline phosphatase family protein [Candidatus Cybelea sp.]
GGSAMTRLGLSCTVGIVAAIGMLAGCGRTEQALPFGQSGASLPGPAAIAGGKIKHIIYIVQEGRSFDNLFQSYPGADTVSQGMNSEGKTIALQPWSLKKPYRIDDSADAMFAACNGAGRIPGTDCKMNGFNNELSYGGPPNPQYVYVPHGESKPYFEMAHEWVVGDKMFASQLDQSYTAHQYVIAAQAGRAVDIPFGTWGCDGPEGDTIATLTNRRTFGPTEFPCFDYQTLGGELEKAGLSWRNYASATGVDGYASIKGSYWQAHVVKRPQQILKDVANGDLASFTWVMPPNCLDSDAGGCAGGYGPSWVAAVVNTVGKSKFWDSTAIFVQWSDWGGFYDHVAPAYSNFDSVGFRVPLLVISPYAKQDYVSHVHYETASVLRFAEDVYGLDRLAAADKRAASPAADCFDFSQKARAFVPIKAPKGIKFFLHQRS